MTLQALSTNYTEYVHKYVGIHFLYVGCELRTILAMQSTWYTSERKRTRLSSGRVRRRCGWEGRGVKWGGAGRGAYSCRAQERKR